MYIHVPTNFKDTSGMFYPNLIKIRLVYPRDALLVYLAYIVDWFRSNGLGF